MSEQDKPYKSIDLTFAEMYAVKYALQDRQRKLEKEIADFAAYEPSQDVVEETVSQLESVRALLATLKTV